MTVRSLHHFNIRSSETEVLALRDFYCDVIGLNEGPRPPFRTAGFWLYAGGAPVLHLTIAPESEALPDVSRRQSAAGHIAFRCSDFAAAVERLRLHAVEHRVTSVPLVEEVQIFLRDPAGLGLELNFPNAAA